MRHVQPLAVEHLLLAPLSGGFLSIAIGDTRYSAVFLALPAGNGGPPGAPGQPVVAPRAPGEPVRVVITDDVEGLRRLLRFVLEDSPGYHVVGEAGDGEEAIRIVSETRPDLVLLDLSMPKMSGLEALPYLRDAAPGAKIVVFSGFQKHRLDDTTRSLGADEYIEKGIEPPLLLQALGCVMRGVPVPSDG